LNTPAEFARESMYRGVVGCCNSSNLKEASFWDDIR
jgi:hypothetical protein